METRGAEEIFKEFKEHSIAEFFKKNRQMLGYSGKVRSLVTVVHEYVTNSVTHETPTVVMVDGFIKIAKIGGVIDSLIADSAGELSSGSGAESLRKITRDIKVLCFDKSSLKLKFKELVAVHRHKMEADEKLYNIISIGGRNVEATRHHSLFRLVKGKMASVEAGKLSKGDYIVVPNACWLPSEGGLDHINLIEELVKLPAKETEKIGVYGVKSVLYMRPDLKDRIKSQLSRHDRNYTFYAYFMSCDRLPVNLLRILTPEERKVFYGCRIGFKKGEHLVDNRIELNGKFASFLGLFVAEGSTRSSLADCTLSFNVNESELLGYAGSAIKSIFGVEPYVHAAHPTATNVTIPSRMVAFIMSKILKCGMRAREKNIPDLIFNVNADVARQFLIGYLCGDGYPTKVFTDVMLGKKPLDELNFKAVLATSSWGLCTKMLYLLSALGYSFNLSEKECQHRIINNVEANFGKSYCVEIWMKQRCSPLGYLPLGMFDANQISDPKLKWAINVRGQKMRMIRKATTIESQIGMLEGTKTFLNGDLRVLKIKEIVERRASPEEYVYDYSVENDENFVGGNGPVCLHNSLDATEEAGILPDIGVMVTELGEEKYRVVEYDNGPGIPKNHIGRALASMLAGTKFHRYMQQRGQQGIGASGCTLFAQITTGKPIFAKSSTGIGKAYSCNIAIDTVHNKPIITNLTDINEDFRGLHVEGEFANVKYENSEHGIYEYLRRTALSNPHARIKFTDPEGKEYLFERAIEKRPERPGPVKPHPLGISVNDLLDFAKASESRKLSSFLVDAFARVTSNKVSELKGIAKSVDFDKDPRALTWPEAEELIKAIKSVKWTAPDATQIKAIGSEQIGIALKNILDPEFMHVVERRPRVFRGGIPFIVEAAVAFGGSAGRKTEQGYEGNILRFANRVPLLFDNSSCAITAAVRGVDWKRYSIDIETQPVSVFVNVSSVYIPYSGVGKEAIAQEDEIIEEIKLAVMDAARGVQHYVSGKQRVASETGRYKMIMRYTKQLAKDLGSITGADAKDIEKDIERLVAKHYPKAGPTEGAEDVARAEEGKEKSEKGEKEDAE